MTDAVGRGALARAWDRYWFRDASLERLALFRILVMALCLMDFVAYSATNFVDAAAVTNGTIAKPWNPIYLFEVLRLEPIGIEAATIVFWVAVAALVCGMIGLRARTACFIGGALCIYWTGLNYSFGKVHHEKVAFAFALLTLPLAPVGSRLSVDAWLRHRRSGENGPEQSPLARFPFRVTQLTLAIGYGFAGCTKLWLRGADWANGYTLMGILIRYNNEWSSFASQHVLLSQILSWFTLVVQGSFPLVLLFPRLRWFYLPAAVGFHVATWQTMDTGPYMTLWFLLIAFLPLERIPTWLWSNIRSGSTWKAIGATGTVALPTALVLFVFTRYFTEWSLLAVLPILWLWLREQHARDAGGTFSGHPLTEGAHISNR